MRTTVELDLAAAQAVQELRRDGRGVSEAVNELILRGLASERRKQAFVQRTRRLGLRVDVSNVTDALDLLEGPDAR